MSVARANGPKLDKFGEGLAYGGGAALVSYLADHARKYHSANDVCGVKALAAKVGLMYYSVKKCICPKVGPHHIAMVAKLSAIARANETHPS